MLEIGFMKVGGGTSFLKMFKIKKSFQIATNKYEEPKLKSLFRLPKEKR
jgi:hypothetical protein